MSLKIIALDTGLTERLRGGAADANGQSPEITVSDGNGNPCRHCLSEIEHNKPMLVLAHRPFTNLQPYAEVGPVFVCGESCHRYPETADIPALYRDREMLIRGYDHEQRIIYGTGKVISMQNLDLEAGYLFENPDLAFIHLRSSTNNCYHFRIER